ncbi:ABC transporter substrate-binding protein [Thermopolyspora sp. NPDC052614]|uniref:ABC transporter substrate-binding protein n=1 Tax=Thermopolyspora sp. NPDC052614 TaxID=3155682 RepID=UPI00343CBA00
MRSFRRVLAIVAAVVLVTSGCGSSGDATPAAESAGSSATHTITDMAGRSVKLPTTIDRVVTLGSVPVINSFLFALGEGKLIVNGLPPFARNPRWKYQYVFNPAIERQPQTQTADGAPDIERILGLKPDVVLAMSPDVIKPLDQVGVPAVVLKWQNAEDVKAVVGLLGKVLGQEERANAYAAYFDKALARVGDVVKAIPESDRRTALYLDPEAMSRPHVIAEWYIAQAGGLSVTREETSQETLKLNIEQILAWNPEVIFVDSPAGRDHVLADPRFANVAAVKDKQVFSIPIAAHTWGNRTSEQPLTVMWVATKLYPKQFADFDLNAEVHDFYANIYRIDLDDSQVKEIVAGL